MTYYLKYRPQTIEELDQENVRRELKKVIKSDNIPHAFLFSGPKGTGKTSAARILAKVVNCEKPKKDGEPCNKCSQCKSITKGENIDVIELDAASHRGIDDIRTLRDAVKLAPANANMKVYIIDEAHMLTTEASNALLKTLEEPPEHVMFILATTNPEKLIGTIRSRVTDVVFKKAGKEEVKRSLEKVVKGEKIKAEDGVLEKIAEAADGSFRDAQKILEQLTVDDKKVKTQDVDDLLFQRKIFDEEEFLKILSERKEKKALKEIEEAVEKGAAIDVFLESLIQRLRAALMAKAGLNGKDLKYFDKEEVVLLIKLLSDALKETPYAVLEQIPLEVVVVEWCAEEPNSNGREKNGGSEETTGKINKSNGKSSRKSKRDKKIAITKHTNGKAGNGKTNGRVAPVNTGSISEEVWANIIKQIGPENASTEALLRAAKPLEFDGETLTIGVYYKFHKEKLESHAHRDFLEEILSSSLGSPVRVICRLTEPPKRKVMPPTGKTKSRNGEVSNGEVADESGEVVLTESQDEDIIKLADDIFNN